MQLNLISLRILAISMRYRCRMHTPLFAIEFIVSRHVYDYEQNSSQFYFSLLSAFRSILGFSVLDCVFRIWIWILNVILHWTHCFQFETAVVHFNKFVWMFQWAAFSQSFLCCRNCFFFTRLSTEEEYLQTKFSFFHFFYFGFIEFLIHWNQR